jgi:collagen triple helix repeat protein
MLQRVRDQVGAAGLVVAIVALVAALAGGAFAATQSASHSKVAKGPRGPRGFKGAVGAAGLAGLGGPVGPAGPAGAKGATGPTGPPGLTGLTGTPGQTGLTGPTGPSCATECNLPSGSTESGVWITGAPIGEEVYAPISFPLHLTSFSPERVWVPFPESNTAGAKVGCPGTRSEPKAAAKKLCIYASGNTTSIGVLESPTEAIDLTPRRSGTVLKFFVEGAEPFGYGTWAITAP